MTPRKHQLPRTLAGFTLIELMAAMAVFSILLVMLLRVFTGSVKTFNAGTGLSKQTSESRLVLDHIASMIESQHFDIKLSTNPKTTELKVRGDLNCSSYISDIIMLDTRGPLNDSKLIQQRFTLGNSTPISDVPLLDHVVDFQIRVYTENMIPGTAGASASNFGGTFEYPVGGTNNDCDTAPVMAVIFLETLNDQNAKIENQNSAAFDESNYTQRYYRTVYLRRFLNP